MRLMRLVDGSTVIDDGTSWRAVPGRVEDYLGLGRDQLVSAHDTGEPVDRGSAALAAPLDHRRDIVCVGLNYRTHAAESEMDVPDSPLLFSKLGSTIVGPGSSVAMPREDAQLDYEAELAVVIGRPARRVPVERAGEHVAGYTCLNDLSDRRAQLGDGQWFRGKNFPGAAPVGPVVVPASCADGVDDWHIRTRVNGEVRQDDTLRSMIHGVDELVSYVSHQFDLAPGDVIATGTPDGVGLATQTWLAVGDEVEVEVGPCGVLRTTIGDVVGAA